MMCVFEFLMERGAIKFLSALFIRCWVSFVHIWIDLCAGSCGTEKLKTGLLCICNFSGQISLFLAAS